MCASHRSVRSLRAAGLLLAAAVVSAAGLAATAATAATAQASGTSDAAAARPQPTATFSLCSGGSYPSYVVFENRHMSTRVVAPGDCVWLNPAGQSRETVTISGMRPDGQEFGIATDTFDDAAGEHIRTLGTPDRDDWTTS